MGFDGIAVETHQAPDAGDLELQTAWVEFANVLTQLKSAGGDCETEIGDAIADATDYDLQVRSVKITGNNATAQVRQGKDGKVSTFTFVKEGGNWRATALGG